MFLLNGQPLQLDTPFTDAEGIQHPANWLRLSSPEERTAIGITEIPDPIRHDDRFYWDNNIPKDLDQLKSDWSSKVNDMAYSLLHPTDWMVVRKMETNIDMPAEVSAYRASVRLFANENQTALKSAANIDTFVTAATNLKWPEVLK